MAEKFRSQAFMAAARLSIFACRNRANNNSSLFPGQRVQPTKHAKYTKRLFGNQQLGSLNFRALRVFRGRILSASRVGFLRCASCNFRCAVDNRKSASRLPRGVTVTQRPLEALFLVRIQAG